MPALVPFRDRSPLGRAMLVGVIPFAFGTLVGVVLGISAAGYWVLAAVATVGGVVAGAEHDEHRGGAARGLLAGALFGLGVLLGHALEGTDAEAPIGSFPPFLIVVDAVGGCLLGMLGVWLARAVRQRAA